MNNKFQGAIKADYSCGAQPQHVDIFISLNRALEAESRAVHNRVII